MRLGGKPAPFPQILSKNFPPAGLDSSLMPVTPESPAWRSLASLCKRLDQSSLRLQTQQGARLVHERGLKHSSQPLPFHHRLSPFFPPTISSLLRIEFGMLGRV